MVVVDYMNGRLVGKVQRRVPEISKTVLVPIGDLARQRTTDGLCLYLRRGRSSTISNIHARQIALSMWMIYDLGLTHPTTPHRLFANRLP